MLQKTNAHTQKFIATPVDRETLKVLFQITRVIVVIKRIR